jgi:deoxyadenosine/deoxycytidine kinase
MDPVSSFSSVSSVSSVNPKTVYCVEGNISSGKTTVLRLLRELGYSVYEEPVEMWQERYTDAGDDHAPAQTGKNVLQLFYDDMSGWGFAFEVVIMITRYHQLVSALRDQNSAVFVERSLITDPKVFALNLYNSGKMSALEWKIYEDWHATFMEMVQMVTAPHKFVYLYVRTAPEECHARKIGRARAEEDHVMPAYFEELHALHDEWLMRPHTTGMNAAVHPIVVIDGNKTRDEVMEQLQAVISSHGV